MDKSTGYEGDGLHTSGRTKVVVVGAGIAGLAAAVKLVCNGIKDVLVLEAQDYVGGRIKSQRMGDAIVDMGAAFIHGEVGNPIFEIAQRLGVLRKARQILPPYFYTADRKRITGQYVGEICDYIEKQFSNGHDPQVGQTREHFFNVFFEQFLQEHQISPGHENKEYYDASFHWYAFYDMINEGVDSLSEISQWYLSKYYSNLEGDQENLIKGGYGTLVRALQCLLPEGCIRTGTHVHNIDWRNPKDGNILVQCGNGDVITTDHVIVTSSLGYLKATHKSLFTPALPPHLVTAMNRMKMGTIGKIFLKWNTPFWTKDHTHFDFLWLKSNNVTLKNDKSKRRTRLGDLWWKYIAGLQTISEYQDILVLWLLEHQLDAIRDLDDQEVKAIIFELMQVFLCDLDVTMPDDVIRTNWKEDPYARGAYSYISRGFDSSNIKTINLPVFPSQKNPRLMFAGEAFTISYMTNAHGAFMTGEEQADKILNTCGVKNTVRVVDVVCENGKLKEESI